MKKKFPIYLQEGIKDCANACIMMILKYYKGNINPIKLSEFLKTTKNGTSAYNIVETLKYLGFNSYGIKTDIDNIKPLPAIAHVVAGKSYKHFIVIYKIDYKKKKILIGDPAKGLRWIDINDFLKIWTSIIIVMYPVKNIVNEKTINFYSFISKFINPFIKKIMLIGILSFLVTILSIINSFFFQMIIETKQIVVILILFVVISLIKIVIEYFRNNLLIKLTNKIDYNVSTTVFEKIIYLPYSYYQGRTSGEISFRINDLKNVKNLITNSTLILFTDLPLMFMSALFLIYLNYKLFFISLFFLLVITFISLNYHKKIKKYIDLSKNKSAENTSYMVESIEGFETIKGSKLETKMVNKFKNKYSSFNKELFRLGKIYNKLDFHKDLISSLNILCIISLGLYFFKQNLIEFGFFITFVILYSYFENSFKNILNLDLDFNDSFISLKRIIDIISYKNIKIKNNNYQNILMEDVYLNINNKQVLNGINFKIKKSEKVLVMGKSGSGKSTMLKLLMKYYVPDKGIIKSGNKEILYVSNNEKLFRGSLLDNLLIHNDNNLEKVTNMCELDEILNNDLGMYQLIEENGLNLSGGQRQRIALARTLMKKFDVLLIDEGFSQMDLSLERRILKNIFSNYEEKTIIVVSHRFDNADLFDRVIKLENGRVTFDEKKNEGEIICRN